MSNRAKSSGISFPDLFVGPNSAVPGTGQIIHTAANLGFSPVSLGAWNTYYSLYVNETFDVTTRLSVNAGARYNVAQIAMRISWVLAPTSTATTPSAASTRWSG